MFFKILLTAYAIRKYGGISSHLVINLKVKPLPKALGELS